MPLPALHWSHPALLPYRAVGERVAARVAAGAAVAEALNAEAAARRFVPAAELPRGQAYEAFVARTGTVPTRDNAHDLFNGLVWLHWPTLKARLNALHAQELSAAGVGPRRGALRDALTLFDENGAWVDLPPPLAAALARHDWHALFVDGAPLWPQAQVRVLGHALLEQLATAPRKGLTAHAWLDDPLVCDTARWRTRPWWPLPLAGIPGWWSGGVQDAAFYADTGVFRPRPAAKSPAAVGAA